MTLHHIRLEEREAGREEGREEERAKTLINLIKAGAEKNILLQVYTEEEYEKAKAKACDPV